MAIHSWLGFRREIGGGATQIESTTQALNLQQFSDVRNLENMTTIPHLPQSAPTLETENML